MMAAPAPEPPLFTPEQIAALVAMGIDVGALMGAQAPPPEPEIPPELIQMLAGAESPAPPAAPMGM